MKKRELLIGVAVATLVVFGGAWLHARTVAGRNEVLAGLHAQTDALKQTIAKAAEASAARTTLQYEFAALESALPVGDDLADLLGPLANDLAALTEADRSLVTHPAERAGVMTRLPMLVSFRSSFPAAFELLSRVNGYSRVVRVRQLVISRPPESDGSIVDVSARLVAYARQKAEGW